MAAGPQHPDLPRSTSALIEMLRDDIKDAGAHASWWEEAAPRLARKMDIRLNEAAISNALRERHRDVFHRQLKTVMRQWGYLCAQMNALIVDTECIEADTPGGSKGLPL